MNTSSEKIYLEHYAQGDNVRKLLKSKNIKSPPIKNKILIAPGLWVIPPNKINSKKELKKFIDEKRKKFKLD